MPVQTKIDKSKPVGSIMGETHNKAAFIQNGIEFDNRGKRITALSPEEITAGKAEVAAIEAATKSSEANEDAAKAAEALNKKEADKAAAEAPPKPVNDEMPNFANFTKSDMVNHARNVFNVEMDPKKLWQALKDQLEGLY